MSELLAPAGTKEAFYAAISNGADAIYLGLDKYSARAYAENFTLDNLKELSSFAHLRNVKIFVTINTIVYDNELEDVYKTIDELAKIGIDAIIVQDLAVLHYITSHYKSIYAHASTQMGIDDIEAAKLAKELGVKRIVFARETSLETIKQIKKELNIEVEAFIHGALCLSYSGNCFMSSMIGERSGNRGRCAGCCRKLYTLKDVNSNENINTSYLLSMKDLNTSKYINEMSLIDSLKIEGRMKEPVYVAAVTNYYRHLLDHQHLNQDTLNKVFNRTYTKGYMFNEKKEDITNIEKPNNYGYLIGEVERVSKGKAFIRLNKPLNKGDQIRIESDKIYEEISLPILRLYDSSFNLVTSMNKLAVIECHQRINVGAKVYKTKDIEFNKEIEKSFINKEYKKIPLDMEFTAQVGKPLFLKIICENKKAFIKSDFIVEKALSSITNEDNIKNQLSKLNDTPYELRNLIINKDEGIFISLKAINEIRRLGIEEINNKRLERKLVTNTPTSINVSKYELIHPEITVEVSNDEQYEAVKELGIKHIYYKNIIRRNNVSYLDQQEEVLVGGLGGINYYRNKNITVVSDYSLNVVNYQSVALLSSLGVNRITISEEINKDNIIQLVNDYYSNYQTYPNLEMIVYGRSKLMHMKYCPLKRLGMCGKCKTNKYELKDEFASFPLKFNDDCTLYLLNSKTLNLIDEVNYIKGINYFRLCFYDESKEEIIRIIKALQDKLNNNSIEKTFDPSFNTRGHFNKNPL